MLVEFSVVPVGKNISISPYVARALKIVDDSGLDYRVNPMGTVIEGEWDKIFPVIKRCHKLLLNETNRVITTITIDDRTDKPEGRITRKVESVEEKLGKKLRK